MAAPWMLFLYISNSICVIGHFMDRNFNKFKACFQGVMPKLCSFIVSKPKDFATVSDNNVRYKQPSTNLRNMVNLAFILVELKKLAFNTPKNYFIYFNISLKNIPYISSFILAYNILKQATPPSISI